MPEIFKYSEARLELPSFQRRTPQHATMYTFIRLQGLRPKNASLVFSSARTPLSTMNATYVSSAFISQPISPLSLFFSTGTGGIALGAERRAEMCDAGRGGYFAIPGGGSVGGFPIHPLVGASKNPFDVLLNSAAGVLVSVFFCASIFCFLFRTENAVRPHDRIE